MNRPQATAWTSYDLIANAYVPIWAQGVYVILLFYYNVFVH